VVFSQINNSNNMSRKPFTRVQPDQVGLQFSYRPPARTLEQARTQTAAPPQHAHQAPSKSTPRAYCPTCHGKWEILEGCPLLKWRRYRLKSDTECPNWACRMSHLSLGWCPITDMYQHPLTPQQYEWMSFELRKYDRGVREGEQVQQHLRALE
jgi:hypothetical protein